MLSAQCLVLSRTDFVEILKIMWTDSVDVASLAIQDLCVVSVFVHVLYLQPRLTNANQNCKGH